MSLTHARSLFPAALAALVLAILLCSSSAPAQAHAATSAVDLNVTYGQSEARAMLDLVNDFRIGSDAWAWNEDNATKTQYNGSNALSPLVYDYELERVAQIRAAELALSYSHTRPNGGYAYSMLSTYYSWGENIAAGYPNAQSAFEAWQETDEPYSGQGHRRNMLSPDNTAIGVGHVVCGGCHYWVQEFRAPAVDTTRTTPDDGARTVSIEVDDSGIVSASSTADPSTLELAAGDEAPLPVVSTSLLLRNTWPSTPRTVAAGGTDWVAADPSVAVVSGGKLVAVAPGSTTLSKVVDIAGGKTVSVPVTVTEANGNGNGDGGNGSSGNGSSGNGNGEGTDGDDSHEGDDPTISFDLANAEVSPVPRRIYVGYAVEPPFTITFNGETLEEGVDYKLFYEDNDEIGVATALIEGEGRFDGTSTSTRFTIVPAAPDWSSLTSEDRDFQAEWYESDGATAYQVQYDTSSTFNGAKTVTVGGEGASWAVASKRVTGLKAGAKYYVRLRALCTTGGATYYSAWTPKKAVTVKRIDPRSVLTATTGDKVRYFKYLDSAKTRAIAITATSTYMNGVRIYSDGRVWFVANGEASELFRSQNMNAEPSSVKLYSVTNGKMFVIEGRQAMVDSASVAWFIKGNTAKRVSFVGGDFKMSSKDEFDAFHSTYDITKDHAGHTYKRYYYHWNGKKLVEYGGKSITQTQLKRVKNGASMLKAIAKRGKVGKIYYRANGVVNVNYTTKDKCYQNVTLKLKAGKLSYAKVNTYGKTALARATDGGIYKPRNPENAGLVSVSYPKKFPSK